MTANLDFCKKCEASYTSREGGMGMCPTCEEQSEAIAEQLREAIAIRDELDAEDEMYRDFYDDCDGNPPYMDNHYPVE